MVYPSDFNMAALNQLQTDLPDWEQSFRELFFGEDSDDEEFLGFTEEEYRARAKVVKTRKEDLEDSDDDFVLSELLPLKSWYVLDNDEDDDTDTPMDTEDVGQSN